MGIEIYQKAKIVRKGNNFYYMLKHHSKNDAICGGQSIIGDNFKTKWLHRTTSTGSWHNIAVGTGEEQRTDAIALTKWNAPTSWIYGHILFGNKKNIALAFAKMKVCTIYENLDEEQQKNVDRIIELSKEYVIGLDNIPEDKRARQTHGYVDNEQWNLEDHNIKHNGQTYWNLDNL